MTTDLHNSALAFATRIAIVLNARPQVVRTERELAAIDLLTTNTAQFDLYPVNLHGDTVYITTEFAARICHTTKGIHYAVNHGLVTATKDDSGIHYTFTDTGARFVSKLSSQYVTDYQRTLNPVLAYVDSRPLREVTKQLTDTEQELSVRSMAASHYDDLASVYVGTIKHLTFVTDAQTAIDDIETPATCPFFDNPLLDTKDIDYRQAAQAEAETITQDLEELSTVRATLDQHLNHLQQRLENLQQQQRTIEQRLIDAVLSQIPTLRQQIQSLEQHQAALTEYRMLKAEHDDLQEQLTKLLNPVEPSSEYDPTTHFPPAFYSEMTRHRKSSPKHNSQEHNKPSSTPPTSTSKSAPKSNLATVRATVRSSTPSSYSPYANTSTNTQPTSKQSSSSTPQL